MSGADDGAAAGADAYDRLRRRVLWSLPTGLYVVGSAAGDRANLMTANLVTQVCIEPKLVGVSVEAAALTCALVRQSGAFALSLLARSERALVRKFVKPVAPDAVERDGAGRPWSMAGQAVVTGATGSPILAAAVASLDCEVRHRLALGSHVLFVGEVVGVEGPEGEPRVLRMEDTRMSYGG